MGTKDADIMRIQMLLEGATKDTTFLKRDNKLLEEQLQQTRGELIAQDGKSKDYFR